MTRDEAASILGVGEDASRAEVQQAFRHAVKLNHPDAAGDAASTLDLGEVAAARDVLLAGRSPTAPRKQAAPQAPRPSPRPEAAPTPPPMPDAAVGHGGMWLAVAAGLFGVIVFVLVALTVIALAFGSEIERDPNRLDGGVSGTLNECVVVRTSSVAVRPCTTLNAQRIDSTIAGPGRCPSGTNTLDVGDTTYCLRPVDD